MIMTVSRVPSFDHGGAGVPHNSGPRRRLDRERALYAASEVFWRKGYSATTLDDLEVATGFKRPSLYLAFGNKEALFLQAMVRVRQWFGREVAKRLDISDDNLQVADRIRDYLDFVIRVYTRNGQEAKGDPVVSSSLCEACEHDAIRQFLKTSIDLSDDILTSFFQKAKRLDLIAPHVDPRVLGQLLSGLVQDLQQRSRAGASFEDLTQMSIQSSAYLLAGAITPASA